MDRDWTASFSIRFRNGTCIIILVEQYHIANSSCHFGSYLRSFGPYNIFLVTDRSIYCHMTLSAMSYLLYTMTPVKRVRVMMLNATYISTIFQLYRGGQFYWQRTLEFLEVTTDLPQVIDKLYLSHNFNCIDYVIRTHNFRCDRH